MANVSFDEVNNPKKVDTRKATSSSNAKNSNTKTDVSLVSQDALNKDADMGLGIERSSNKKNVPAGYTYDEKTGLYKKNGKYYKIYNSGNIVECDKNGVRISTTDKTDTAKKTDSTTSKTTTESKSTTTSNTKVTDPTKSGYTVVDKNKGIYTKDGKYYKIYSSGSVVECDKNGVRVSSSTTDKADTTTKTDNDKTSTTADYKKTDVEGVYLKDGRYYKMYNSGTVVECDKNGVRLTQDEVNKNAKSGIRFTESRTIERSGVSAEEYYAMSEDERLELAGKVLQEDVDKYNKANGTNMSVAQQFEKFLDRCETKDQAIYLAKVLSKLSPDNQDANLYMKATADIPDSWRADLEQIIVKSAEEGLAGTDNEAFGQVLVNGAETYQSEEGQMAVATAAQLVQDTDVQEQIVTTSLEKSEELGYASVGETVSNEIGNYFVDPQTGKVDEEKQANISAQLSNSKFESVRVAHATNVYQLTEANQKIATDTIVAKNEESVVTALATNSAYCAESNQTYIQNAIKSTGYESAISEISASQARKASGESAKKATVHYSTASAAIKAKVKEESASASSTSSANSKKGTYYSAASSSSAGSSYVAATTSQAQTSSATGSNTASSITLAAISAKIDSIVNDNTKTINQKANQIKLLSSSEQDTAIEKLISSATLPEIKSLALSGLKSEVLNYLFSNFNATNKSTLDSLEYLMDSEDKKRYSDLIENSDLASEEEKVAKEKQEDDLASKYHNFFLFNPKTKV